MGFRVLGPMGSVFVMLKGESTRRRCSVDSQNSGQLIDQPEHMR